MKVREVTTKDEFEAELSSAGDSLVLVDYSTTWCGPCKLMDPKLEAWSDDYPGVVFLKVVGDRTAETNVMMKQAGIRSVPSFHFYKRGERVLSVSGAKSEEIIEGLESHQ